MNLCLHITQTQGTVLRLTSSEQEADPVVAKLFESSEEGQKVTRNSGSKWCAVFERVAAPNR